MSGNGDDFARLLERKAPAYLDLLTAATEAEFNDAFDDALDHAIRRLERSSKDFEKLGENALNRILGGFLNCPGLAVTAETHSNGHVDFTIMAEHSSPIWMKLGEAKMYGSGPSNHIKGLVQLLSRYTTGRETRGVVVDYVNRPDITGKIVGIRVKMDTDLPEKQLKKTKDHKLKWSFISTHDHSVGSEVEVLHVGVNMHPPNTTG